jgi:nucleoside-diphosphate-sugar epimerase
MSLFRFVQWISKGVPVTVFGDGQQSRDFTYVDDIASGTVAALKPVGYEVVNLGSDRPAVLMDTIKTIEQMLGGKATIEFLPAHTADVLATWANISKAKNLLEWQPQTTLNQGIQNLVDWYQSNERWAKDIKT